MHIGFRIFMFHTVPLAILRSKQRNLSCSFTIGVGKHKMCLQTSFRQIYRYDNEYFHCCGSFWNVDF